MTSIALTQTVFECAAGEALARATEADEEALFVLSGAGALRLGDGEFRLEAESGAYLEPGEEYQLVCAGSEPLRVVSVRIADPAPADSATGERAVVRRLDEQEAQAATAEREFRIVADPATGLRSATHFVGYIPPGRAPIHFHKYDEVILVLDGEGFVHIGEDTEPIAPGSSITLPARTLHCVENSGTGTMRVQAVFRPAGSPAEAYYPDGSPASYPAATSEIQGAAGAGDADPRQPPEEERSK